MFKKEYLSLCVFVKGFYAFTSSFFVLKFWEVRKMLTKSLKIIDDKKLEKSQEKIKLFVLSFEEKKVEIVKKTKLREKSKSFFVFSGHICLVWPTGCPRSSSPAGPPASCCLLGQEGRQGGDRPYSSHNATVPYSTIPQTLFFSQYHSTLQILLHSATIIIQQYQTNPMPHRANIRQSRSTT